MTNSLIKEVTKLKSKVLTCRKLRPFLPEKWILYPNVLVIPGRRCPNYPREPTASPFHL